MFVFFYIKNNSIFRFFEHQISKQKKLGRRIYIYDIFLEQVLDSRVVLGMGIIILLMENTKYISSNIKSKYYKLLIYMCDISYIMLENICGVFITNITRFTYIYIYTYVSYSHLCHIANPYHA